MTDLSDGDFKRQLLALGVLSYKEQENLLDIAKRCSIRGGIPMGAAALIMGKSAEAFLAGVLAGTVLCTMANMSMRSEIKKLANDGS